MSSDTSRLCAPMRCIAASISCHAMPCGKPKCNARFRRRHIDQSMPWPSRKCFGINTRAHDAGACAVSAHARLFLRDVRARLAAVLALDVHYTLAGLVSAWCHHRYLRFSAYPRRWVHCLHGKSWKNTERGQAGRRYQRRCPSCRRRRTGRHERCRRCNACRR